ncbi:Uncharacterised protein [Vibrio cholerae]|nr:Uncharacterised protein [Vibrio cholerae]
MIRLNKTDRFNHGYPINRIGGHYGNRKFWLRTIGEVLGNFLLFEKIETYHAAKQQDRDKQHKKCPLFHSGANSKLVLSNCIPTGLNHCIES